MIITCENCSIRFTLDESLLKPEGSKVRCSQCRHVFTAFPTAAEPETDLFELDSQEDLALPSSETDFPEDSPEQDADSPEIEFDTDFEDVDFDQGLDFDEADLSFETEGEAEDGDDADDFGVAPDEIEFDVPDLDIPDLEMDSDAGEDDDLGLFAQDDDDSAVSVEEFPTLEMESSEAPEADDSDALEEIQFEEELKFDELEMESADDSADIEISFDEDDAVQELEAMPLEMDLDESQDRVDEADFQDEGLSFEAEDLEFEIDDTAPTGDLETEGHGDKEVRAEETLEHDLDLSFDEDLGDDIQFDEPLAFESQAVSEARVPDPFEDEEPEAFPDIEDFPTEDALPGDEPQTDPENQDAFLEEEISPEDDKFAEYDQVLDQDTEPEGDFPGLDEEIDSLPASPPEDEAVPPEIVGEESLAGPLIEPPLDSGDGRRRRKKKTGGISAPVKLLALLFLLVIAGYLITLRLGISVPFLDQLKIPFITQAFKPAPPPVAAIGPIPNDASTNGRFVTNATAGRLFIVTGKADNPDKIAYSHIRIRGTLLTKEGKKAATQTIYCGNVISEEVLKSGNISDISKQLNVKEGMQGTNINIKPGQSVRFMLVFSNLPENLANFTVEILDYTPAGPQ